MSWNLPSLPLLFSSFLPPVHKLVSCILLLVKVTLSSVSRICWIISLGFDQVWSLDPYLSCFVKWLHNCIADRAIFSSYSMQAPTFWLPLSACLTATASNLSNHLTLQNGCENQQEWEKSNRDERCGAQINFKTTYQIIRQRRNKGTVNLLRRREKWINCIKGLKIRICVMLYFLMGRMDGIKNSNGLSIWTRLESQIPFADVFHLLYSAQCLTLLSCILFSPTSTLSKGKRTVSNWHIHWWKENHSEKCFSFLLSIVKTVSLLKVFI